MCTRVQMIFLKQKRFRSSVSHDYFVTTSFNSTQLWLTGYGYSLTVLGIEGLQIFLIVVMVVDLTATRGTVIATVI